jgi:hypothetical protein
MMKGVAGSTPLEALAEAPLRDELMLTSFALDRGLRKPPLSSAGPVTEGVEARVTRRRRD